VELFYQIGVSFYFFIVRIASLWNVKAKQFIDGRKEAVTAINNFSPEKKSVYWFHCASLGEFEQARPLIENLKNREDCKVVVSFFSPSGYEIRKNYELADLIVYLPKDSAKNAKLFLDKIQPAKIFFVKYEFWANYLLEARRKGISTYLVSGVFRKKQVFFKWYGGFMKGILNSFETIFVQDEASRSLLSTIGIDSLFTGDTRYDRVMENAQDAQDFPLVRSFLNGKKAVLIGSPWSEDDAVIMPKLNRLVDEKIIVAPHEVHPARIKEIEIAFDKKTLKISEIETTKNVTDFDVLIIDNIGVLMHLYQYAKLAYVGGAFGKGLHNILEPASFKVPVIFGANHSKFPEAYQFINAGIGFSVNSKAEFDFTFDKLINDNLSDKVNSFMISQVGATHKIISKIF
jgi:3-deoxy-D-manno-octulosonic-acid transferase